MPTVCSKGYSPQISLLNDPPDEHRGTHLQIGLEHL